MTATDFISRAETAYNVIMEEARRNDTGTLADIFEGLVRDGCPPGRERTAHALGLLDQIARDVDGAREYLLACNPTLLPHNKALIARATHADIRPLLPDMVHVVVSGPEGWLAQLHGTGGPALFMDAASARAALLAINPQLDIRMVSP